MENATLTERCKSRQSGSELNKDNHFLRGKTNHLESPRTIVDTTLCNVLSGRDELDKAKNMEELTGVVTRRDTFAVFPKYLAQLFE